MTKHSLPAGTVLLALLLAAPAGAQSTMISNDLNSPASVRCSALAELEAEAQVGAVQFLAGYSIGQRNAMSFGTAGASDLLSSDAPDADVEGAAEAAEQGRQERIENEEGAQATPEEDAGARSPGPTAAVLPTVPVEAVLAACAQSPDSRVIDILVAQGVVTSQ